VDVVVAKLGFKHSRQVWEVLEERMQGYQPKSNTRDWDEEVRFLTAGSAVMILEALGPLAFPDREVEMKRLYAALKRLSSSLNEASHHQEGKHHSAATSNSTADLILELLTIAEAVFGELPWHLAVSFVYGQQPKVLSGEAWGRGSPNPRLLSVIVWSGNDPGSQVMVWNKERRKPIVTDPVFIVRPTGSWH
jgi:hypothetical protein